MACYYSVDYHTGLRQPSQDSGKCTCWAIRVGRPHILPLGSFLLSMARAYLSDMLSHDGHAFHSCILETLRWLGASSLWSLAICCKDSRQQVAVFRQGLKKIVLEKSWHLDRFAGLYQHRHLEEVVVVNERECIQTPLPQPLQWRDFAWDGGKVWRLLDMNSSTLRRVIFKSAVWADPEPSRVPEDDFNTELLEVYFHHLYRCPSLETLELRKSPPPDRFPVNSFVREVFGRLRHLELGTGDWMARFDHTGFGESLTRAFAHAGSLQSLFLSWNPQWEDGEREDVAFMSVWESATLPRLQRLRLRGNVLYKEDCTAIAGFINRHSNTLQRLQLQLSNRVAICDRSFVTPARMLPTLAALPRLKELVLTMPETYFGPEADPDVVNRIRCVCLPVSQILSTCPALECLVFLVDKRHMPVGGVPQEIGHVEVAGAIREWSVLLKRSSRLPLRRIYFLHFDTLALHDRACTDDHPLQSPLDGIHESHPQKPPNALMLNCLGDLDTCHVALQGTGIGADFIREVMQKARAMEEEQMEITN